MHYNTWQHTCCLPHSKIRHQSSGAAVQEGPAEGGQGGGTPGRVSRRISTACLSHGTHSPLESSARVSTTPDVAFLPPTAWISSKCFPSLLLRLLRRTVLFSEELYRSVTYKWKHVMTPWFLYRKREWALNSHLYLSCSIHELQRCLFPHMKVLSFPVRSRLFTFPGIDTATEYLSLIIPFFRFFPVLPYPSGTRGQVCYRVLRVQLTIAREL